MAVRLSALGTLEIYIAPENLSVDVEEILKHIFCACLVVFKATEQKTKRAKIIILCEHLYIVVYSVHVLYNEYSYFRKEWVCLECY
jgi:hypothetical protein